MDHPPESRAEPLSLGGVNDDVLGALRPPRTGYYLALALLAAVIGWFWFTWVYQNVTGLIITGLNIPVGWGTYITNFVFWVGIAHSGTLISAILFLVRARWRDAVSRSAEAMTVIAVMTAGLFPLIHLGRLWVFYYLLPYPSQRQLWPNFLSPLVWDVLAVSTYLIVSTIFFYVGLIPDLAAARDRARIALGARSFRARLYRGLSLGWSGAGSQWRHYGRSYLFFAALATPLVVSVHSVVSWDFAMSLLPGWHSTIFAPYFVAGAIHSGLAMVLLLLIPMRRLLRLERVITADHFEAVAKTIVVTALIIGYAYAMELFIAWYSGDLFERQMFAWRATGWPVAPMYWALFLLNVFFPLAFLSRRARRSVPALLAVAFLITVGMWLERYLIITSSLGHGFLPHTWSSYAPTWAELSITAGSFAFFLFLFLGFAKVFPTAPVTDLKTSIAEEHLPKPPPEENSPAETVAPGGADAGAPFVLAIYADPGRFLAAVEKVLAAGFRRVETFSPMRMDALDRLLGHLGSPVRIWTLAGGLLGLLGGFALAIGAALVNRLIVGGKPPVSLIPYCIVGFEGTILLGSIANLVGMIVHSRLYRTRTVPGYDPAFGRDRFGLLVSCEEAGAMDRAVSVVAATGPDETRIEDGRASGRA